jgi:hypothetical protein
VAVISTGQLLFKVASASVDFRRPFDAPKGLAVLALALALYAGATLLWVAALKHAPLGRVYPLMALSFILVPLGSILLLRETRIDAAMAIAEAVRAKIAGDPFETVGAVSASFGVAEWNHSEDPRGLINRADKALYQAKHDGRNRVVRATA